MEDFKFKIAGKNYTTKVVEEEGGSLLVTVNGKTYQVEMPGRTPAPKPVIRPAGGVAAAPVAAPAAAAPKAAPVMDTGFQECLADRIVAHIGGDYHNEVDAVRACCFSLCRSMILCAENGSLVQVCRLPAVL